MQEARPADPDRLGDVVEGRAVVAVLGEALPASTRIASRVGDPGSVATASGYRSTPGRRIRARPIGRGYGRRRWTSSPPCSSRASTCARSPGPSTRIDLTGVQFSLAAPSAAAGHHRAAPRGHRPLPARRAGHRRPRGRLPRATASRSPATCSRCRSSRASSTTGWCGPSSSSTTTARSRPTAASTTGPSTAVPFTLLPPVEPLSRRALRRRPLRAPARRPTPSARSSAQVLEQLGPEPDLAVLFVTGAPSRGPRGHRRRRARHAHPRALVGATAVSVLGGDREVEEQPRRSPVRRRALRGRARRAGRASTRRDRRGVTAGRSAARADLAGPRATALLLADPFSFPVDAFLDELAGAHARPARWSAGWRPRPRRRAATGWSLDDVVHDRRRGRRAARRRRAGRHRSCRRAAARSASRSSSPGPSATWSTRSPAGRRSSGCIERRRGRQPEDRALARPTGSTSGG